MATLPGHLFLRAKRLLTVDAPNQHYVIALPFSNGHICQVNPKKSHGGKRCHFSSHPPGSLVAKVSKPQVVGVTFSHLVTARLLMPEWLRHLGGQGLEGGYFDG